MGDRSVVTTIQQDERLSSHICTLLTSSASLTLPFFLPHLERIYILYSALPPMALQAPPAWKVAATVFANARYRYGQGSSHLNHHRCPSDHIDLAQCPSPCPATAVQTWQAPRTFLPVLRSMIKQGRLHPAYVVPTPL